MSVALSSFRHRRTHDDGGALVLLAPRTHQSVCQCVNFLFLFSTQLVDATPSTQPELGAEGAHTIESKSCSTLLSKIVVFREHVLA
jgi:hypothetical protein